MDNTIKKPAVTVFMAAYNASKDIKAAIDSVLNQTFPDFELLIVNDGSTDDTAAIVGSYQDSRIRLVHNPKNMGLVPTRNVALSEARGKYLAILDSDDIAYPERLQLQFEFLESNPEMALCGGHAKIIDEAGTETSEELTVPSDPDVIKRTLLFRNTYVNSSTMFKTEVLRELGGYRNFAPAEDYDLFIRISDRYPVSNLDKYLVKYRTHLLNTSSLKRNEAIKHLAEIKASQLQTLNLDPNQATLLLSFLLHDFSPHTFKEYLSLFSQLKTVNNQIHKYKNPEFNKMLFDMWFDLIFFKKAKMNALALLFKPPIFDRSFLTARQFRKALKLSLKGIGRLSK